MKLTKSQKLFLLMSLREVLVTFPKGTDEQVNRLKAVVEDGVRAMFNLKPDVEVIHAEASEKHYIDGVLTLMEEILKCEEEPEDASTRYVTIPVPARNTRGHRRLRGRR